MNVKVPLFLAVNKATIIDMLGNVQYPSLQSMLSRDLN